MKKILNRNLFPKETARFVWEDRPSGKGADLLGSIESSVEAKENLQKKTKKELDQLKENILIESEITKIRGILETIKTESDLGISEAAVIAALQNAVITDAEFEAGVKLESEEVTIRTEWLARKIGIKFKELDFDKKEEMFGLDDIDEKSLKQPQKSAEKIAKKNDDAEKPIEEVNLIGLFAKEINDIQNHPVIALLRKNAQDIKTEAQITEANKTGVSAELLDRAQKTEKAILHWNAMVEVYTETAKHTSVENTELLRTALIELKQKLDEFETRFSAENLPIESFTSQFTGTENLPNGNVFEKFKSQYEYSILANSKGPADIGRIAELLTPENRRKLKKAENVIEAKDIFRQQAQKEIEQLTSILKKDTALWANAESMSTNDLINKIAKKYEFGRLTNHLLSEEQKQGIRKTAALLAQSGKIEQLDLQNQAIKVGGEVSNISAEINKNLDEKFTGKGQDAIKLLVENLPGLREDDLDDLKTLKEASQEAWAAGANEETTKRYLDHIKESGYIGFSEWITDPKEQKLIGSFGKIGMMISRFFRQIGNSIPFLSKFASTDESTAKYENKIKNFGKTGTEKEEITGEPTENEKAWNDPENADLIPQLAAANDEYGNFLDFLAPNEDGISAEISPAQFKKIQEQISGNMSELVAFADQKTDAANTTKLSFSEWIGMTEKLEQKDLNATIKRSPNGEKLKFHVAESKKSAEEMPEISDWNDIGTFVSKVTNYETKKTKDKKEADYKAAKSEFDKAVTAAAGDAEKLDKAVKDFEAKLKEKGLLEDEAIQTALEAEKTKIETAKEKIKTNPIEEDKNSAGKSFYEQVKDLVSDSDLKSIDQDDLKEILKISKEDCHTMVKTNGLDSYTKRIWLYRFGFKDSGTVIRWLNSDDGEKFLKSRTKNIGDWLNAKNKPKEERKTDSKQSDESFEVNLTG